LADNLLKILKEQGFNPMYQLSVGFRGSLWTATAVSLAGFFAPRGGYS